ncbi:MAG: hypothetical protein E7399_02185 [Ruminococcaceae bacterium]|nr:hypothetical protein [Oscillospiraceae bacterium]
MEWKGDLKVRVTNLGSPWLSIYSVWDVQKAVRLGVRFFDNKGNLIEEQRGNFGKNMLRGDNHDFTFSWPEGAEIVSFELVQEFRNWFSQLGDTGVLTVNRQGKEVPCPERDNGFHTLYPQFLITRNEKESLPDKSNLQGFSGGFTGAVSSYCHININCEGKKELAIKMNDLNKTGTTPIVTLNDTVSLKEPVFQEGEYCYSLQGFEGRIEKITLECETYNPFEESGLPKWMSFLSLDSNLKPVQFMVHRMEDLLGKNVNNHEYGVQIERIVIR